jgi:hypothetical protein
MQKCFINRGSAILKLYFMVKFIVLSLFLAVQATQNEYYFRWTHFVAMTKTDTFSNPKKIFWH